MASMSIVYGGGKGKGTMTGEITFGKLSRFPHVMAIGSLASGKPLFFLLAIMDTSRPVYESRVLVIYTGMFFVDICTYF